MAFVVGADIRCMKWEVVRTFWLGGERKVRRGPYIYTTKNGRVFR